MIAKPVATAGHLRQHERERAGAERATASSGHRRFSTVRPGCTSGSEGCMRALASRLAIGGEVSARRPSQIPITAATTHQPAATGTTRSSPEPSAPPASVTAASAVAAAALISTVVFEEVGEPHRNVALGDQQLEQLAHALRSVDDDVGLAR